MSPFFSSDRTAQAGFQSWHLCQPSCFTCGFKKEVIWSLVPGLWQSRGDTLLQIWGCQYNSINAFQEIFHEVLLERQTQAARKHLCFYGKHAELELSGSIGSTLSGILLSAWSSSLFSYLLTMLCSQKSALHAIHRTTEVFILNNGGFLMS